MNVLFDHVALLPMVIVLLNATIAQHRLPAFLAVHGGERSDASRFIWGGVGIFLLYFGAIDGWVHASGTNSVLCFIPTFSPRGPMELAAWAIYLALPLGLVLWSWLGRGAELLARFTPLFAKQFRPELTYKPQAIRWLMLFICASALIVPAMMTNAHPREKGCGLPGGATASRASGMRATGS